LSNQELQKSAGNNVESGANFVQHCGLLRRQAVGLKDWICMEDNGNGKHVVDFYAIFWN
jgi:hypothetical protein